MGGAPPTSHVEIGAGQIDARLTLPSQARALIVLAYDSGSSRNSSRDCQVAAMLQAHGLGTLLIELTGSGEAMQRHTAERSCLRQAMRPRRRDGSRSFSRP